jgi:hypothetical protein
VPDRQRHTFRHVGLAAVRRAERHRRRHVQQKPRRQRALAHVHAHVRLAHARGHVPVDVAHVVAREVGADHRQLRPAADLQGQMLARDQALDPPQHRQVERAQHGRRHGPGDPGGPAGARPQAARAGGSWQPPRAQQRDDAADQKREQRAAGERAG